MQLGHVVFVDLRNASYIAQAAAYAASVERMCATLSKVIEAISRTLGTYAAGKSMARRDRVSTSCTDAGKLEPMEAARALALGYLMTAPERTLLRIFILGDRVFEQYTPFFRRSSSVRY